MSRSAFAFFVALAVHAAVLPTVTAATCLSNVELSVAIVNAVQSLRFNETFDLLHNTTTHAVNNLDVSVIAFDDSNQCPPTFANVLLTRDFPYGRVSSFDPSQGTAGTLSFVHHSLLVTVRATDECCHLSRYQALSSVWIGGGGTMFDGKPPLRTSGTLRLRDSTSICSWCSVLCLFDRHLLLRAVISLHCLRIRWFGSIVPPSAGADKFMSPHPASSFKVMVATGVMFAVERGLIDLMDDASINITVRNTADERVRSLLRCGVFVALFRALGERMACYKREWHCFISSSSVFFTLRRSLTVVRALSGTAI